MGRFYYWSFVRLMGLLVQPVTLYLCVIFLRALQQRRKPKEERRALKELMKF